MANWKKIAEAFGRAVQDPGRSRAGDRLVRNTATQFERPREKYEPEFDRITREPWTDEAKDVNRAFVKGELEGWKAADDAKNAGKDFDELTETRSDAALKQDFDDGFEEALNKRRGKIRDAMGDARGAEEAADAGIDDIRKVAIEMLKSGQDIGDVLRILKGSN